MPLRPELRTAFGELQRYYSGPLQLVSSDARGPFTSDSPGPILAEVESHLAIPLRPDARVFLLSTMQSLVLAPIRLAAVGRLRWSEAELLDAIGSDLRTVCDRAAELSLDRSSTEISSRIVLQATAQTWDRLILNRFRWWGVEE